MNKIFCGICSSSLDTGVWKVIAYNACDKPCVGSNYGTQTRSILCISFNGKEVNKTNCDHALKPPLSKKCFTPKCRTSWSVGDWSKVWFICCFKYWYWNDVLLLSSITRSLTVRVFIKIVTQMRDVYICCLKLDETTSVLLGKIFNFFLLVRDGTENWSFCLTGRGARVLQTVLV